VYGFLNGVTGNVAVVAVDEERKKVLFRVIPKFTPNAADERGRMLGTEQEGDLSDFTPIPGQSWEY
jgi:hypothetical protein